MFLSLLQINPDHPLATSDRRNVHRLHQRVMGGFPDEQNSLARAQWRILFRVEPDAPTVFVQSEIRPNWSHFPRHYLRGTAIAPLTPLLAQIQRDRVFPFRITANPTRRNPRNGKTEFLEEVPDQIAWLQRKGTQHGFTPIQTGIIPPLIATGHKTQHRITVAHVTFSGTVQITDPELAIAAVQNGIGRGKAYGCGLLSLIFQSS